jgi:hypothetical protein
MNYESSRKKERKISINFLFSNSFEKKFFLHFFPFSSDLCHLHFRGGSHWKFNQLCTTQKKTRNFSICRKTFRKILAIYLLFFFLRLFCNANNFSRILKFMTFIFLQRNLKFQEKFFSITHWRFFDEKFVNFFCSLVH